jgi:hypothetical protein
MTIDLNAAAERILAGREPAEFLMSDARAIARVARAIPQWMDRPSTPGMWLCVPDNSNTFKQLVVTWLSQPDLDRGAPFHTRRVYGPIPADA